MSMYYGTVQGNRGEATRCGSINSGIMATAQSWEGSVMVRMYTRDETGTTMCEIVAGRGSTAYPKGNTLYHGPLAKLLETVSSF
jgi:hypothetical protein